MADQAVQTGKRIGVIATLSTTLQPTSDLVKRRAAKAGKTIELETVLCEGAFDALMSGDAATHDALVTKALRELSAKTDVIVLAQASMGRVADNLAPEDKKVPILASPAIAIQHIGFLVVNNREQAHMKKIFQLFLVAGAAGMVVLLIGIIMQQPQLYKPAAVCTAVFTAIGLGAVPALKGYRYTAWIIAAVVAGMMFPASFTQWGTIDLRNKWLMLIIIQMVMFGMGIQMSWKILPG